MIFDIAFDGETWLHGFMSIACLDADFPKHDFKLKVQKHRFGGSKRVLLSPRDPESNAASIQVGSEVFKDRFPYIDRVLKHRGLLNKNQCFYIKVL